MDANGVAEAGMVTYSAAPNFSSKSYGAIDSNGSSFVQLTYDQNRAAEVTGFLHCHLNNAVFKCLAVFSLSDFVAFGQLIENSTKTLETFTMYVTSDKGTFAVKITDKQELIDFKDYIVSNPIQALKDFENNVKHNQSPEKQIKGLLNFLKSSTANNSIQLYQSDSNYQNWQQLYIDSSNKVKTKKC